MHADRRLTGEPQSTLGGGTGPTCASRCSSTTVGTTDGRRRRTCLHEDLCGEGRAGRAACS
ncbi:hypothetical protein C5E16_01870 [Clavibacter michiganensis]|uniref:Uncharacterized protein n=1 Tax=Clavibacter michiganensis TaxID=28447 RepID=A0A2S5VXM4_9MICO|nr:hypothetical protein C5E16_01870 [Clavibacter michiganensis]